MPKLEPNMLLNDHKFHNFSYKLYNLLILGKFTELCELLNKSNELLTAQIDHLDSLLETFNLENHTMAILAILIVKMNAIRTNSQFNSAFFTQLTDFAINANVNQVLIVPETCKFSQ